MLALLLVSCFKPAPPAPPPVLDGRCGVNDAGDRTFVVLHLNDVYRIEGLLDDTGGLARVRTLRTQLEAECGGPVLLTHAGDAFYPSLSSQYMNGKQMVDVLNWMDGTQDDDPYAVAVFGNHEFDKGKPKDADDLFWLLQASDFAWLDTNLDWDDSVLPMGDLQTTWSGDLNGVSVGIYGMTIDKDGPAFATIDPDYATQSQRRVTELRPNHDVVIGLTHLDVRDDMALLGLDQAPDVILGGHDHQYMRKDVDGRLVLKGDADAASVIVAWITVSADGAVTVHDERVAIGPDTPAADPLVQQRVDAWGHALDYAFCVGSGAELGCLDIPLGTTQTLLMAAELTIRRYESNLGNWLTDLAAEAFADDGVQVVLANSGSIRLNQDIPAGAQVTQQQIEEMFPYDSTMVLVDVTGAQLQTLLENSVSDWTGNGHWAQVSGVAFRFDPDAGTVTDVHVMDQGALRPVDPQETLRIAVTDYMGKGGDGYTLLGDLPKIPSNVSPKLKDLAIDALHAAGDAGIAPVVEGRICNAQQGGPCLLD